MKLIQTVTVGAGGASSIDFNGITQSGYNDLYIVVAARTSRANHSDEIDIKFNGVTTNLAGRWLSGDGASVGSGSAAVVFTGYASGATTTANTFGSCQIYIPNYTGTSAKAIAADGTAENNATNAARLIEAGSWNNSAAITSISLYSDSGSTFQQGSMASLYGIAAGSDSITTVSAPSVKATGGTSTVIAGGYVYHVFKTSGTFTPTSALTADILVVGGGGGMYSGGGNDGGAGAGGLVAYTAQSLTTTGYTVTVGQGGAQGGTSTSPGGNGSNSSFGALTAAVGGGGGGGTYSSGATGGSGGGGGGGGGAYPSSGAAGTSGQGNAGGNGFTNPGQQAAGGGGGAGAAGANGVANVGGNGGAGSSAYSAWGLACGVGQNVGGTVYFAGGGGGGSVATRGVDGNGSGAVNTGGGMGIQTGINLGYSFTGWSGVVIVRYQ